MIEFVEECRQEWKRLCVPDAVANEMAADLEADLQEAEAEGVAAEAVLGSGAFDPRSFAASWAAARGVVEQPPVTAEWAPVTEATPPRRWGILVAVAISAFLIIVGAALAAQRHGSSAEKVIPVPAGLPGQVGIAPAFAPTDSFHAHSGLLGIILLMVGIAALVVLTVRWSPWARQPRTGTAAPSS